MASGLIWILATLAVGVLALLGLGAALGRRWLACAVPPIPPARSRARTAPPATASSSTTPSATASPAAPRSWVLVAEDFDAVAAARALVESSPEIRSLYRELGFSLSLERRCAELLAAACAQIRAEIPDFALFRETLDQVVARCAAPDPATDPAVVDAYRSRRDDPLLREVVDLGGDAGAVLAALNRDPVHQALPFIELLPLHHAGRVIWRSPSELRVLRKRPADDRRFSELLRELDQVVRAAGIVRDETRRRRLLDAVARAERDLQRPDAYLPAALEALTERLEEWLGRADHANAPRRRQLEELLRAIVEVRHCHANALELAPSPARRGELLERLAPYRRAAVEHGDVYVRSPWMHRGVLTHHVLHNLLTGELVEHGVAARADLATAGGVLARICAETASGHFDGAETARRLRRQEDHGLYVHSLVYALLRLDDRVDPRAPV